MGAKWFVSLNSRSQVQVERLRLASFRIRKSQNCETPASNVTVTVQTIEELHGLLAMLTSSSMRVAKDTY